jgi:hypothetical protein
MRRINFTTKNLGISAPRRNAEADPEITNMMLDPRYLRQSSSLIQDALQKGFDVLQLANGDIVTTGTKTVVYQYAWDEEKGKLVKAKTDASRKAKRSSAPSVEGDEEVDSESESESEDL